MTDYTLLAVTGLSPQVVTETVWAVAQEPGRPLPGRVVLVTTGTGAAFVDAVLLGEERSYRGSPIKTRGPGWCALGEALGEVLPVPEVVAPARPGERAPLADLLTGPDAALVADAVYRAVHDLTAPGQPPLVASIAGGRKTMSADLQSAFSVYARPGDRLVHVLVDPAHERSDFLFPTAETGDADLTLVEVRVPRLRRVLAAPLLDALPADRRGLEGLLDALAPLNYAERPVRAEVALGTGARGACTLTLFGTDGVLGELVLRAAETATLLALAESFAVRPEREATADDLLAVHVQRARSAVMQLARFDEATPWKDAKAVSTAVNRLNTALAALPMAADVLGIGSELPKRQGEPVRYGWASPPGLPVSARYPGEAGWLEEKDWPFRTIPLPTVPEEG